MPHACNPFVIRHKCVLKWLKDTRGELSEETDYFSDNEDLVQFLNDMLETHRLFEIIEIKLESYPRED